MRWLGGAALIALGALGLLAGLVLAVAFGPDNRMTTGPHKLSSPGPVITTAPQAIGYAGPRVELRVEAPGRELFAGVGHHVDVADLFGDVRRSRIDRIDLPWRVETTEVGTEPALPTPPTEVDWWYAHTTGTGEVLLAWTLPERGGDVVVAALDGQPELRVQVSAAWVAPGIFMVGAATAVIGLGAGVFGWALLSSVERRPRGVHARRAESAASDEVAR